MPEATSVSLLTDMQISNSHFLLKLVWVLSLSIQRRILGNLLDPSLTRLLEGLGPGTQGMWTQQASLPGCCPVPPYELLSFFPLLTDQLFLLFHAHDQQKMAAPESLIPKSRFLGERIHLAQLDSIPGVIIIERGSGLWVLRTCQLDSFRVSDPRESKGKPQYLLWPSLRSHIP